MLQAFSKGIDKLHTALKALSFRDITRVNEYLGLTNFELTFPQNFCLIIYAYTSTIRKPDSKNKSDQMFCTIPFKHKVLDSLNMQSLFKLKFVRDKIPAECKLKDPPIISYKYGVNIGQKIMNYKTFLTSITLDDITSDQNCDCLSNNKYSNFTDPYHKHVFTGNLDIVHNSVLRETMKKGTKFRVCPKLNIDSIFQDVCNAFDTYCKKMG